MKRRLLSGFMIQVLKWGEVEKAKKKLLTWSGHPRCRGRGSWQRHQRTRRQLPPPEDPLPHPAVWNKITTSFASFHFFRVAASCTFTLIWSPASCPGCPIGGTLLCFGQRRGQNGDLAQPPRKERIVSRLPLFENHFYHHGCWPVPVFEVASRTPTDF